MKSDGNEYARFAVYRLLALNGLEGADSHRWIWEGERWKELVFAFLCRIGPYPAVGVRILTDRLYQLGLLDVTTLATLSARRKAPTERARVRHQIHQILAEAGFTARDSKRALETIIEAAVSLEKSYDGKIQLFLRKHGEAILQDAQRLFHTISLPEATTRQALVFWLQNVASMPVSLSDENLTEFCRRNRCSVADLEQAADEMNLNLAALDDIVYNQMRA